MREKLCLKFRAMKPNQEQSQGDNAGMAENPLPALPLRNQRIGNFRISRCVRDKPVGNRSRSM
jgi:hypothetical protein